jgi:hypothetical protein
MRLDLKARQSLVRVNAERYQKSSKKEKGKILDELVESTGYRRCYASLLLSRHGKPVRVDRKTTLIGDLSKRVRKKRDPIYGPDVLEAVKKIWANLDFLCGKRLKAVLTETLARMEKWGEMKVASSTKQKLERISAATIDRLLAPERRRLELKSRSGTKPGTLLKSQIQIRTSSDWDENRPGFGEIDLVSHGGGDERGDFAQSLCFTDIASTWSDAVAVRNKSQFHVFEGLQKVRKRLPFKLLGIDSDNGSEFINAHLVNYCREQQIIFTRSRPYRKNDNCFVEEKNYTLVRRAVGYLRYDTAEEVEVLDRLYHYWCLRTNYFLPTMKLIQKTRVGSKVVKKYDSPRTPYQRLLASKHIPARDKQQLRQEYHELNPAQLTREIGRLQEALLKVHKKKNKRQKLA